MALSNLRKSIFYLQQAMRERSDDGKELLQALNILVKVEKKNNDINDPKHYNTTEI